MKSKKSDHMTGKPPALCGFTRIELLVVAACLGLLALAVIPGYATASTKSKALSCINNYKRLILAWQMYADDNHDVLVGSYHGGAAQGGAAGYNSGLAPWVLGWLDWGASQDNTNTIYLTNSRYCRLAPYLKQDPTVFKCPADNYLSPYQRARHWTMRVRSVSGNIGVGGGNAEMGPWLGNLYKHIRTMADFTYPGPAETWVYVDEHADSINDAGFFNPQIPSYWTDQPASYHNAAAPFAYADGHAELHRWQGSLMQPRALRVSYVAYSSIPVRPPDPDIQWMCYHGGRISTNRF
jgi:prepilin-type processing-associated H-X9-DG protein